MLGQVRKATDIKQIKLIFFFKINMDNLFNESISMIFIRFSNL